MPSTATVQGVPALVVVFPLSRLMFAPPEADISRPTGFDSDVSTVRDNQLDCREGDCLDLAAARTAEATSSPGGHCR